MGESIGPLSSRSRRRGNSSKNAGRKHLQVDLEATGSNEKVDDLHDLPKLYRKTADQLSLSPSQHSEDAFKRIPGLRQRGRRSSTLRNKVGDAHGQGKRAVKPAPPRIPCGKPRGAMALFLVETWAAKNAVGD
jgi:hypothetical protein